METTSASVPFPIRMELGHLRAFVAVAQVGHLTRAAETLHLSQPAVSGQIKALEEDLGVTLFERSSSGMTLTPSGRLLLQDAEQIIGAVQRLRNTAQELHGQPTGTLRLGTVLDPAFLRVGHLLALAFERYPQIELELHQVLSGDALISVRNGELDASFYFGARPEPPLEAVAVREMSYRVAMPAAWAKELTAASFATIAERPWIITPERSSHRLLVMDLFRDHSALPDRTIEADNESVITNLIESGVGMSLVREEIALASASQKRSAIWHGTTIKTRLWLISQSARAGEPLLVALLDVLDEVWSDMRRRDGDGEVK